MWLSQIHEMSIGPLWLLRQPTSLPESLAPSLPDSLSDSVADSLSNGRACPTCGADWLQVSGSDRTRVVVLAGPVTDARQQTLLHNCLRVAQWQDASWFQLHENCAASDSALQALQQRLVDHGSATILAIGHRAAQLLDPLQQRGQLGQYHGAKLIVTHHPQQVLDDPVLKAEVWTDLCLAMSYVA